MLGLGLLHHVQVDLQPLGNLGVSQCAAELGLDVFDHAGAGFAQRAEVDAVGDGHVGQDALAFGHRASPTSSSSSGVSSTVIFVILSAVPGPPTLPSSLRAYSMWRLLMFLT